MIVKGAYGRSYKRIEAAKRDWNFAERDFLIEGTSTYMSKRDWNPLDSVMIRINDKLEFIEVGML